MRARFVALLAVSAVSLVVLGSHESSASVERLTALSKIFAGYEPTTFEWTSGRAAAASAPTNVSASEIAIAYSGAEKRKMTIAQTEDCHFRVRHFTGGKAEPDVTFTVDFKKIRTASANIYTAGPPAVMVPGRAAVTSQQAGGDKYTNNDFMIMPSGQDGQSQLALVKEFGQKHCPSKIEDTAPRLIAVGSIFADYSAHTLVAGDIAYNVAGMTLSELYMARKNLPEQATKIVELEPCIFSIVEVLNDNTEGETEIDFNRLNFKSIKVRDGVGKENELGKRRVITVAGKEAHQSVKSFKPGLRDDLVLLVEARLEQTMVARLKEVQKHCKGL